MDPRFEPLDAPSVMKSVWGCGGGCFSARVRTIEGRVGSGTILLSCAPAPTFWQNSYPGPLKYGIPAPNEPVISGREVWWGGRESDLTVIRELAGSIPTVGTSRRFFLVLSCVDLVLSCVFFVWHVGLFFDIRRPFRFGWDNKNTSLWGLLAARAYPTYAVHRFTFLRK